MPVPLWVGRGRLAGLKTGHNTRMTQNNAIGLTDPAGLAAGVAEFVVEIA